MAIWFANYSDLDLKKGYVGLDKYLEIEFLELGEDYLRAKMPVNENTKHQWAFCMEAHHVFWRNQLQVLLHFFV